MNDDQLKMLLQNLLFVADHPIPSSDIAVLLEIPAADVDQRLGELSQEWSTEGGLILRNSGGGWWMATNPEAGPYLERFVADQMNNRLSQAALETLAIVAYRQPISRAQISEIRGVNCDRVLRTLSIAGLVEEAGRDDSAGRAILYQTNSLFLEKLGLNSITDLPPLDTLMPDSQAVERMESGLGPGV